MIRFFVSLRFAQNDNYLTIVGREVEVAFPLPPPSSIQNDITRCHSERSEESLNFFRIVFIFLGKKWYPKK